MATDKRMTTIHISKITDQQLTELKEKLGLNQTEIITMAIDRLFHQETEKDEDK